MFDLPLHPVVVHFPIAVGTLLPFAALLTWWLIKKGIVQHKIWVIVMAMAFIYIVSAVVAVQLGDNDEDKVEKVLAEKYLEEHEEYGEMIPWVAGGLLLLSLPGYFLKNSHTIRLGFIILSLIAIYPLANAGHTGGELVYKYGAARAHIPNKGMEGGKINNSMFQNKNHTKMDDDD